MRANEDRSRGASVILGVILIAVGLVFLAIQNLGLVLPFDLGSVGWPLFVIAPGFVLLVVGLLVPATPGLALTIAGGIVTAVGLLLAYQSSTDHLSSWAYAWALVAPGSVGAAMLLWGVLRRHGDTVRGGLAALATGVVLFLVGFAFFEGVLNLGGDRGLAPLGRQALPLALIVAGVLVILTRLWPRGRGDRHHRARHWSMNDQSVQPPGGLPADPLTTESTDRQTT